MTIDSKCKSKGRGAAPKTCTTYFYLPVTRDRATGYILRGTKHLAEASRVACNKRGPSGRQDDPESSIQRRGRPGAGLCRGLLSALLTKSLPFQQPTCSPPPQGPPVGYSCAEVHLFLALGSTRSEVTPSRPRGPLC